jgi:hypothetical protein
MCGGRDKEVWGFHLTPNSRVGPRPTLFPRVPSWPGSPNPRPRLGSKRKLEPSTSGGKELPATGGKQGQTPQNLIPVHCRAMLHLPSRMPMRSHWTWGGRGNLLDTWSHLQHPQPQPGQVEGSARSPQDEGASGAPGSLRLQDPARSLADILAGGGTGPVFQSNQKGVGGDTSTEWPSSACWGDRWRGRSSGHAPHQHHVLNRAPSALRCSASGRGPLLTRAGGGEPGFSHPNRSMTHTDNPGSRTQGLQPMPVLQMENRLREGKQLAQGHRAKLEFEYRLPN